MPGSRGLPGEQVRGHHRPGGDGARRCSTAGHGGRGSDTLGGAVAPGRWLAGPVPRLQPGDVACWVLKSASPPDVVAPGWTAGTELVLERCVRRSYRLDLMAPGRPCLLWVSGRDRPGVHALGEVTTAAVEGAAGPMVGVRLTRLVEPVHRAELVADPAARDAEVLRMPAGSNPSWLSAAQYAAVLGRVGPVRSSAART